MSIKYFKIQSFMSSGEVWETIRHTKEGMEACIESILSDKEVVRFTVEEIV